MIPNGVPEFFCRSDLFLARKTEIESGALHRGNPRWRMRMATEGFEHNGIYLLFAFAVCKIRHLCGLKVRASLYVVRVELSYELRL